MTPPRNIATLATELGVSMATIYALVRTGKVASRRQAGDRAEMLDLEEVRAALAQSRPRGRPPKGSQPVQNAPGSTFRPRVASSVRKGDIVSYEKHPAGRKRHGERGIAQVGETRPVSEGMSMVRLYDGNGAFGYTDWRVSSLSERITQGLAAIESPETLLSMLIYQFVRDARIDLAASLELWMDANDLKVIIPDLTNNPEDLFADENAGMEVLTETMEFVQREDGSTEFRVPTGHAKEKAPRSVKAPKRFRSPELDEGDEEFLD